LTDNRKADLVISGYGNAAGGEYGAVKINGYGRITGDVKCDDMRMNGAGEAAGVECASLHINGTGDVAGPLKATELKVNGTGTFTGAARCESAKVTGTATFRAGLDAQLVDVTGSLKVKGDCNAERFVSSGVFDVDGLLSADHIEVFLDWNKSRAKEIGGSDIAVKPGPRGMGVLHSIFGFAPALEAGTIEGNEISLELTKAAVVRGNNVVLGDGCDIGLVEYKGTLRKMGNARVGEEKKV
jgi:cytoskeletal protein CcmA (bactofilin family)